ncbi:MAG TPA: Gfo/Idh/MocA family oxidoreductase [Limnochordia bacterium]
MASDVKREVGFGVVGLGMGRSHCKHIVTTEGARLIGVADLLEERGREAEQQFGTRWYKDFRELLEQPGLDVVVVAVPSGLHAAIAIEAAQAGKHVLCEKPLEVTVEKANQIIDACRQHGVKLAVNFQNRFAGDMPTVKRAVEAGVLGRLYLGEARLKWFRTQEYYDQSGWRGTWKMDGGGALMNQTVHTIDLLQWVCGRVRAVRGEAVAIGHQIETEDLGLAILTFENGARGTILGTTAVYPNLGTWLELHGERGSIVVKDNRVAFAGFKGVDDAQAYLAQFASQAPAHSIADLVAAVREDREPSITGVDARHAVEIIRAVYQSAQSGKVVTIDTEAGGDWSNAEPLAG